MPTGFGPARAKDRVRSKCIQRCLTGTTTQPPPTVYMTVSSATPTLAGEGVLAMAAAKLKDFHESIQTPPPTENKNAVMHHAILRSMLDFAPTQTGRLGIANKIVGCVSNSELDSLAQKWLAHLLVPCELHLRTMAIHSVHTNTG